MRTTPTCEGDAARFTVNAGELGLRPGFDPDRMNQLVDELQVAETQKKWRNSIGR